MRTEAQRLLNTVQRPEAYEEVLINSSGVPIAARGLIQLSSKKEAPALDRRNIPALTPRQLEVLRLLSEGSSAKEIGQELYLSQATVRNHIRSLLQALGAHSQLEALAKARELGLLTE